MFNKLDSVQKWERILEQSKSDKVVVMKHSNTCPISTAAYKEMEKYEGEVNLVVVQTERGVSNQIAEDLELEHQSPQIMIIENGKQVYNTSHLSINADKIKELM